MSSLTLVIILYMHLQARQGESHGYAHFPEIFASTN